MIEQPSVQVAPAAPGTRLTLVLGAGGVRGLAHIGVLAALWEEGCRPDALLGVSSGSLVASTYAALGWEPARLEALAHTMGRLAIFEVALASGRLPGELERVLGRRASWFGPIHEQLAGGEPHHLHHGVSYLGVTCYDLIARKERLFVTSGGSCMPTLLDTVLGSSALPLICPARALEVEGVSMRLIDGGLSRAVPVVSAFDAPFCAERVLAVDLQVMTGWNERALDHETKLRRRFGDRLRVIKPSVGRFGTILMKRGDPARLVAAGRAAVTPEIRAWLREGALS